MITLGRRPDTLNVILSRTADFIATLHRQDNTAWPAGTVVTLTIGETSWPATVAGADLSWNVDKATVATAHAAGTHPATLTLTQGTADLTWAEGKAFVDV